MVGQYIRRLLSLVTTLSQASRGAGARLEQVESEWKVSRQGPPDVNLVCKEGKLAV